MNRFDVCGEAIYLHQAMYDKDLNLPVNVGRNFQANFNVVRGRFGYVNKK